ncbi:MAG: deoxyhypusine synthase family protein [Planctomycetes bacterium]|nr:deoxyhypusine synthase family protein [Planctomycetota bacterium]
MDKVSAVEVKSAKSISELLKEMGQTGFQGRKLAESVDLLEKLINDADACIFLGYAGSMSTTGQWKIINWFIENRYIDVLVSTGANISEDIVEAMGSNYLKGIHCADDSKLLESDINRYYDVYGRESDYMEMTEMIATFYLSELISGYPYSSRELLNLFGKWLLKKDIDSIVATAAKHGVPIFCPAIVDSPYGDAGLIAKSKGFNLVIDNMKDYTEFMSISEKIKESGVFYIGGGVPKDFIQLLAVTPNLLYPQREIPTKKAPIYRLSNDKNTVSEAYYPHKYALQITTDSPQWGGLSGCTFEEAISWGKEASDGHRVQCYCDATIALPIISHAIAERITTKRKGIELLSLFVQKKGKKKNIPAAERE